MKKENLTIALAKGRTGKQALKLLEASGITFSELTKGTRKLVIWDDTETVKLILVKAVDVPTYVETGAAEIGIVGKDIIMEDDKDVYELLDLQISCCKLVVAGFPKDTIDRYPKIVVASKYPNVTRRYFSSRGIPAEVIKLNGSIELAPLIGMSDVIVDIVETGTTLKENGLVELEDIAPSSARVIVNKAGYARKTENIQQLIEKLKQEVKMNHEDCTIDGVF